MSLNNHSAFDLLYVSIVTKHHISKSIHTVVCASASFLLFMTIIDDMVAHNMFFTWQWRVALYFTMHYIFALCVHKNLFEQLFSNL